MNLQKRIIEIQDELITMLKTQSAYNGEYAMEQLESELASLKAQEAESAEEFVKNKLNEKTGQGITLYEHYLAHDTTISIGTAVSWIKEYASQPSDVSDEDIEKWAGLTAMANSIIQYKWGLIEGAKAHRDGKIKKGK